MTGLTRGWTVAVLIGAIVVLIASVAMTLHMSDRGPSSPGWMGTGRSATSPSGPSAATAGTVVDVVSIDMDGGRMMGMPNGANGDMMRLTSSRADAPAGTVTLRLYNAGTIKHELVVLPLTDGQQIGGRSVGAHGAVGEADSLGEASKPGGEGAGDGIEPGTTGWVTLDLPPGRYEIACNIENHYAAGMYTLLVVG